MRKLSCIYLLLICLSNLEAQKEHQNQFFQLDRWLCWIDTNYVLDSLRWKYMDFKDCALNGDFGIHINSISDSAGNLLFIFTEKCILDRNFEVIENGDDLFPPKVENENHYEIGNHIILPKPGKYGVYYLIVENQRYYRNKLKYNTNLAYYLTVFEVQVNYQTGKCKLMTSYDLEASLDNPQNKYDGPYHIIGADQTGDMEFKFYVYHDGNFNTMSVTTLGIKQTGSIFIFDTTYLHKDSTHKFLAHDIDDYHLGKFYYIDTPSHFSIKPTNKVLFKGMDIKTGISAISRRKSREYALNGCFTKNNQFLYVITILDSNDRTYYRLLQYHFEREPSIYHSHLNYVKNYLIYEFPIEQWGKDGFHMWRSPDDKIYIFDKIRDVVSVINSPEDTSDGCRYVDNIVNANIYQTPAPLIEYKKGKKYYIDAAGENLLCIGDTLRLKAFFSEPEASFQWSGPNRFKSDKKEALILNVNDSASGIYTLKCSYRNLTFFDTLKLTVIPYPEPKIYGSEFLCGSLPTVLYYDSLPEIVYKWIPEIDSGKQQTVYKPGKIGLAAFNRKGCSDTAFIDIKRVEPPKPEIVAGSKFCYGDTAVVKISKAYNSYNWSTGDTSSVIKVTKTTNLIVSVVDSNGCMGIDKADVYFYKPSRSKAYGPNSACKGDTLPYRIESSGKLLDTIVNGGDIAGSKGASIYILWKKDGNGNIILKSENEIGCISYDTLTVYINDILKPTIEATSKTICDGVSVRLAMPESYSVYKWSNGKTDREIDVEYPGAYWCYVKTESGCDGYSDTLIISKSKSPEPIIKGNSFKCSDSTITLSLDKDYKEVVWSTGHIGANLKVAKPGIYYCEATDSLGCKGKSNNFEVKDYVISLEAPIDLSFDNAPIGDIKDTIIIIKNNSNTAIELIDNSSLPEGFKIISPLPVKIQPGDSAPVKVRFTPEENKRYSASLNLGINPCSESLSIRLEGTGIYTAVITAFLPDTSADAGKKFCIPVYVYSNIAQKLKSRFTLKSSFNSDLIAPELFSTIKDNELIIDLDGEAEFGSEPSKIGEICGTILLPKEIVNKLTILEFELENKALSPASFNGSLTITGVCEEDIRHVEEYKPISLSVNPNPNSNNIKLQIISEKRSYLQIEVYNVQGALVYSRSIYSTGLDEITIEALSQGIYQIVAKNGSQIKTINAAVKE